MFNKGKQVILLFFVTLLTLGLNSPTATAQYDETYVSYNDFYENLAPYGQWIDDPKLGYVWSPEVSQDFRPYYTNGHWVMTDYGNTWISDYPWGWAAFHYGRWTYDPYYGWLWIPGSNWGPAWVSWRYGEGSYGWAPLGPGYEVSPKAFDYNCPNDWWVFIPPQYLYGGNYYRYWYGPRNNSQYINNSTIVNNQYSGRNNVNIVSGPHVKQVESSSGQPVQVYKLANSRSLNTTVHNNVVKMYHPAEIRQEAPAGGQLNTPPNLVSAPHAVRTAQPIAAGQGNPAPQFRSEVATRHATVPGTTFNEVATPRQQSTHTTPRQVDYDRRPQQPEHGTPQFDNPAPVPAQQARNGIRR